VIDEDRPGTVEQSDVALRLVSVQRAEEEGSGSSVATSERTLVRSARAGDMDAFATLVERRTAGLVAFLRRMLGDVEDARDVAQLTFVKVWQNLDKYDPSWAFSTWLYRIAGNLAIDSLRSRGSRSRTETESFRLVRGGQHEGDAHASLARDEVRRVFEACATVLSEKQKLVFVLREFEERENAEIAEILICRESTVRNHLFQARRLLRDEIGRRFPEYVPGGSALPLESEGK
jgi:RNA polymerase sigma-70 factor (ECF subfamily)